MLYTPPPPLLELGIGKGPGIVAVYGDKSRGASLKFLPRNKKTSVCKAAQRIRSSVKGLRVHSFIISFFVSDSKEAYHSVARISTIVFRFYMVTKNGS